MGYSLINIPIDEAAKLENITEFYFKLKELMLYTEILGDQEIFLPPVNELRLSNDRIMRFISGKCQPNGGDDQPNGSNGSVDLDKAMSSISNAILQSLDYIAICQLEYIQSLNMEDGLDPVAIEAICPGTDALIPTLLLFQKDVQNLKSKGTPITKSELDSFILRVEPIREHIEKIIVSRNVIAERDRQIKNANKKKYRTEAIIALVAALLGAGGAYALNLL